MPETSVCYVFFARLMTAILCFMLNVPIKINVAKFEIIFIKNIKYCKLDDTYRKQPIFANPHPIHAIIHTNRLLLDVQLVHIKPCLGFRARISQKNPPYPKSTHSFPTGAAVTNGCTA